MPKVFIAPFFTAKEIEEMPHNDPRLRKPFSCEDMFYDGIKRQYIPTPRLYTANGINFESLNPGEPNERNQDCEHVSDQIYAFSDKQSGSDIETLKCLVAHHYRTGITPFRFREMVKDIFVRQGRFYANNGDYCDAMTVDIANKQWVDKVIMNEDRHIDPKVKQILQNLGLCWVGTYDRRMVSAIMSNEW